MLIPDTPYVITLDADSLLQPRYATTLVRFMEQPEHARVAVAQTPYSALPNPPGILEQTAGATTDIQYLVHQGFTRFGATFWVGANALLKKSALEDICTEERGGRGRRSDGTFKTEPSSRIGIDRRSVVQGMVIA